jgi:hypothetical protein
MDQTSAATLYFDRTAARPCLSASRKTPDVASQRWRAEGGIVTQDMSCSSLIDLPSAILAGKAADAAASTCHGIKLPEQKWPRRSPSAPSAGWMAFTRG